MHTCMLAGLLTAKQANDRCWPSHASCRHHLSLKFCISTNDVTYVSTFRHLCSPPPVPTFHPFPKPGQTLRSHLYCCASTAQAPPAHKIVILCTKAMHVVRFVQSGHYAAGAAVYNRCYP